MKFLKFLVIMLLIAATALVGASFYYAPLYFILPREVALAEDSDTMTIMSTNVRFYNPLDTYERSWMYRAPLIVEDINAVQPDIIGFQESTFIHYDYLTDALDGYASENAYRDDFILSEGCPIFYRRDKFELIDSGSFWLSETPDEMSKDWGSEHYRICVYVKLREKASGKEFAVFNTHLDSKSEEARIKGIAVVLEKIRELGGVRSYLMGDLNAKENSETMAQAYESFNDSQKLAPVTEDTVTYHNWGTGDSAKRIDYILVSKSGIEVTEYHVVDNCHGGVYSSDHASIYVKTRLK